MLGRERELLRQVSVTLDSQTDLQRAAESFGADVTVLDCRKLNEKDMALLIEVRMPDGDAGEVISAMKARKIFKRAYAADSGEVMSKSLCVAIINQPASCQAVMDCGAFCLSCPHSSSESRGSWNLLVKDSFQLKALLTELGRYHIDASIGGLSDVRRSEELTSRQMEVLTRAILLGYFEFPRRLSLTELGQQLGIKPSSLSQVLRAAEEKVMARYATDMKIGLAGSKSGRGLSARSGPELTSWIGR